MQIHPTAVVDPTARIGQGTVVEALAFIGPQVEIGPDCRIGHHATVECLTTIGEGTRLWPYASVGTDPQDLTYQGEPTRLEVGKGVKIREFVTINRGTPHGSGVTRVGDGCMLMAYSHVAHDCQVGEAVVMANCATIGGHVVLQDHCILSGLAAVHQFARVGRFCFVGGMSGVSHDLPPYTMCDGNRAKSHGLNIVGLKRAGFTSEAIDALKKAYRIIFRSHTPLQQALEEVRTQVPETPEVKDLLEFIASSRRGVAR